MLATLAMMCCLSGAATFPNVTGLDGRIHQPIKEAAGKPVVLIFICHDCPICNADAPEIARIERAYEGRASIDIVYSEPRISAATAREHSKAYGLTRTNLFLDESRSLAEFCKATTTPEAIVYDGAGNKAYSGRIDDLFVSLGRQRLAATTHDLRAALDAVLAHKTPKPSVTAPVGCIIVWPKAS